MNTIEKFKDDIRRTCEHNAMHKIPSWMADDIFEYIIWDPRWRMISDKPGYIIGISEDHWDYYFIYLYYNEEDDKLEVRYISCSCLIKKECKDILYSPFKDYELNYIKNSVKHMLLNSNTDKLIFI